MRELLTELRDRDFDLIECHTLFRSINDWIEARDMMANNDNPNLNDYYRRQTDISQSELEEVLEHYGLTEYTIDEFITYD